MGEHNEDQGDVAEPPRPPLTIAQAREVTTGLREAMDDVRRSVAVLAARVRDAHAARVWVPLGYSDWASFCDAEFDISRAQAYRLLYVARSLAAILGAVTAGTEMSRTRDTDTAGALVIWACERMEAMASMSRSRSSWKPSDWALAAESRLCAALVLASTGSTLNVSTLR
jgi:hypothetical protein